MFVLGLVRLLRERRRRRRRWAAPGFASCLSLALSEAPREGHARVAAAFAGVYTGRAGAVLGRRLAEQARQGG